MKSISLLSPISHLLEKGRLLLLLIALCFILSAGVAAAQTADDHGDTFATATPLSLGSSIAGRIDHGDDHDVFEIDLSGASGLTDVWAYATGEYDSVGSLYDSNRALLSFSDDSFLADSLRNFSVRSSVPPGIYYVVVASYAGEPGDYTMHAQAVTDPGSSHRHGGAPGPGFARRGYDRHPRGRGLLQAVLSPNRRTRSSRPGPGTWRPSAPTCSMLRAGRSPRMSIT